MHAKRADSDWLNDLARGAIGCAFTVLNTLGIGVLEEVYANAVAFELRGASLLVVQPHDARVYCHDVVVGDCVVDLLVGGLLLVQLKTVKSLEDARLDAVNQFPQNGPYTAVSAA